MRISSSVFLCLLSASLVTGIAIINVPTPVVEFNITTGVEVTLHNDTVVDVKEPETTTDNSEINGTFHSTERKLLRFIPKVVRKIFVPPPKPAPAPKPKHAPAPKVAAAAPKPKPAPAAAPKPFVAVAPVVIRTAPTPAPKPVVAVAPVVIRTAPTPSAPAVATTAPVSVYFTCDNEFDMYVNGNKVGRGTSWTTTYQFSLSIKPGDVIAIDGVDIDGPAAFIGVFGGRPTKPADWRCSTKESKGWTLNNFDDSSWSKAVSYGKNADNNIWRSVGRGSRPNIPADAEWLWTSDNNNHNRVYCRYFMTPAPAPAPVAVVVAPKAVPAPVAVAPAPPVPVAVAPAPVTKQSVIDEIIKARSKASVKLTKFQEKLLSLMKETSDEQVKIETENRDNYNGVSVTLQNEQLRLETARANMKKLYDETLRLNSTIQTHYKKLIADTEYLQSLDAMRPAFLKSLDELASHIQSVKTVVDRKLVKDEYKEEMVELLTGIHFNTHNISGYVATAFMNHYNKYKSLIQKENTDYSAELKRLNSLANDYRIQAQKTADIEKDRARLEDILSKLKITLSLSVTQREEFEMLIKEVVSIFDKKRC